MMCVFFKVYTSFVATVINMHRPFFITNHKNYNILDSYWFKAVLFSTNLLAKLLSDSLNQPITFKVVITCCALAYYCVFASRRLGGLGMFSPRLSVF